MLGFRDLRTPAQRRIASFLIPAVIVALAAFVVLEPWVDRTLGAGLGTPVAGALLVAPVIALYRYGTNGASGRASLAQGVLAGVAIALIYWLIWIVPRPAPWWLQR